MRRWSAVASAVVVVGAAAGFAVVTSGVSGAAQGVAEGNLAANPVLATDAQGWGVLSGGSGARAAVSDHPSAQFAYKVTLSGGNAGIYLPQQAVTGGASYTIAVDTKSAGSAHMQMDWYGNGGSYLGSSEGQAVATTAGSWKKVSAQFTAPAGATNSHPLEYVTGASGTWLATNADYESGSTDPTDPTDPPTDPTDPPTGDGDTAAGNFGWGTALPASDEFNYTGSPDQAKWGIYGGANGCGAGHAGNGQRCGYTNTVQGGYLRQTGYENGDTAGISMQYGQRYGRWEVRARITSAGGSGFAYHPVLITWPDSDQWPQGGEYDYFEVNVGDSAATAFLHHPTNSGVVQDEYHHDGVDLAQWHNYGFEWAPDGLTGYLDGQVWFHDTDPGVQAPGPMHQTIQLDNFCGCAMQKAYFDVDWSRVYGM